MLLLIFSYLILIAILLFGPICVGIMVFFLDLVYFKAIQHLFLFSSWTFAGS